jgi:hypothetical protein
MGVSLGDPTMVQDGNQYYMFATCGGPWFSEDLINWKYSRLDASGARVDRAEDALSFDPTHQWQPSGDANERTYFSYLEGPWVFKRAFVRKQRSSADDRTTCRSIRGSA